MAIDRDPRRYSRRAFLGILVGGAAVGGAIAQRELFKHQAPSHEALTKPSPEDIRRLEALIESGQFTQLEPTDMVEGKGVVYQSVTQHTDAEMDSLISMLADYDIDTGWHRLQHQVADLGSPENYLSSGLNHLVLTSSDSAQFEIVSSQVRVFAAVSRGSAEFALTNPTPQELDHFLGLHLSVRVDSQQDGRPNPGIRPVVVVLPK